MHQAIITKYFGPTDRRGSRIQAKCDARTIYVEYDDALNTEENHTAAAEALASAMRWRCTWAGGCIGNTYVFVARHFTEFTS